MVNDYAEDVVTIDHSINAIISFEEVVEQSVGAALHIGFATAGADNLSDQVDFVDVAVAGEEVALRAEERQAVGGQKGPAVEVVERHGWQVTLPDAGGSVVVIVVAVVRLEDQPGQSTELPRPVADGDVGGEPCRPAAPAEVARGYAAGVAEDGPGGVGERPLLCRRVLFIAAGDVEPRADDGRSPRGIVLVEVVVRGAHLWLPRVIARAEGLERQLLGQRAPVGVVPERVVVEGVATEELARRGTDAQDHGVRLRARAPHRVALHDVAIMHLHSGRFNDRVPLSKCYRHATIDNKAH